MIKGLIDSNINSNINLEKMLYFPVRCLCVVFAINQCWVNEVTLAHRLGQRAVISIAIHFEAINNLLNGAFFHSI